MSVSVEGAFSTQPNKDCNFSELRFNSVSSLGFDDEGIGIKDFDIARQPFFTTKPDEERSGMGFTIMESFMDELKVESILGLGTKIYMKKIIQVKKEN